MRSSDYSTINRGTVSPFALAADGSNRQECECPRTFLAPLATGSGLAKQKARMNDWERHSVRAERLSVSSVKRDYWATMGIPMQE